MTNFLSQAIKRITSKQRVQIDKRPPCLSKHDYREAWRMTLYEWLLYHQKDIAFEKCSWMGIRMLKSPLDAWICQEIVHEVKPDIIIEIGSYMGGTTLYLAHLLDILGHGQVISIDIDRTVYKARHDRIIELTGDSSSDEIVSQVRSLCEGKTVLVFHDGGHAKTQVLKDLSVYAPLVTLGSYFVIEDGIVDIFDVGDGIGIKEEGPLAAVEEFLGVNKDFTIDAERERYIMTYNPRGFLRRIKRN